MPVTPFDEKAVRTISPAAWGAPNRRVGSAAPFVRQVAAGGANTTGSGYSATFPKPPIPGSIIVAMIGSQNADATLGMVASPSGVPNWATWSANVSGTPSTMVMAGVAAGPSTSYTPVGNGTIMFRGLILLELVGVWGQLDQVQVNADSNAHSVTVGRRCLAVSFLYENAGGSSGGPTINSPLTQQTWLSGGAGYHEVSWKWLEANTTFGGISWATNGGLNVRQVFLTCY